MTATLNLDINQLRLLGKTVSRTVDSLTKQLDRMPAGHARDEVKKDWGAYDDLEAEIRHELAEVVNAL